MRRPLPLALLAAAVLVVGLLSGRSHVPPAGAATPTKTPTLTPPASLPGRFIGKLSFAPGIKPSGKSVFSVYTDASTKCIDGKMTNATYSVTVPKGPEQPGCPNTGATVYFKLGDYWAQQQGTWVAGMPVTLDLKFPKIDAVSLATACTNTTMTFTDGTAVKTVLDNLTPASSLAAIWRWNGTDWDGYFPGGPTALNNLKSFDRLDVVWLCNTSAATLNRPSLSP